MKICHMCRATYDDSMFFCLEDGSVLSSYQKNQPSDNETEPLINPILPKTIFIPPAAKTDAPPRNENISFSLEQPPVKRNANLLLIVLALLGLSGAAIGGYFLFNGRGEREIAAVNANSNTNTTANYESGVSNISNKNLFPNLNSNVNQNSANIKTKPTPAANTNRRANRNIAEESDEKDDLPIQKPSPAPNPSVETPDTISGGVVNGKATNLVKPNYPPAAKAVRASGTVTVRVLIDENGNVISASATSGHPLLRDSAAAAARQSKFSPTVISGQKVKVRGNIVYNFAP